MEQPHPDWIIPDWPAPPGVKALITTRAGGVSQDTYASMNVGLRTGDDARAVAQNRERLRACLPQEPKWLPWVLVGGAALVGAGIIWTAYQSRR